MVASADAPRTPIWPTEVDRVAAPLYENLGPGEAADDRPRVAAVQALTRFSTGAVEPALLLALDDPSMPVRREALHACYARTLVSCVQRATELWRDGRESTIRIAALRVVAMAPAGHAGLLRDALKDPAESIRAQAAQFLGWSPLAEPERAKARAALMAKLADLSAVVRRHVVDSLGLIGDADAVLPIARLLPDPEPTVRAAAATALARLHDDRAVPPLRRALDDPNEPLVTRALVKALALLGDETVEEDLLRLLDDPPQGIDMAQVADAIGRRPDPGATLVTGLVQRLREPGQRDAAVDALRLLGERAYPQLRAEKAKGLEPPLQVEIDQLLGRPTRNLPTSVSWPGDGDVAGWHARVEHGAVDQRLLAGVALGQRAPAWLPEAVAGVLHVRVPLSRRRGWLAALAMTREPVTTSTLAPWVRLVAWASDPAGATTDRCLAAAALSAAGGSRAGALADDTLHALLADRHAVVRGCAALGLGRRHDGDAVGLALADPSGRVRAAAALALVDPATELDAATAGRLAVLATADPSGTVRRAAALALRLRDGPADAPALSPWWHLEPRPEFSWAEGPVGIPAELDTDDGPLAFEVPAMTFGPVRWAWLPGLSPTRPRDPSFAPQSIKTTPPSAD
jgi:HEAT repeat protein